MTVRAGQLTDDELQRHRAELVAYCYRMLGCGFEAEDAVQETLLRAWRSYDSFEGRSSVRSWLYRIATNVCLTMASAQQRRARPMERREASDPAQIRSAPTPLPEATWISPLPDSAIATDDPAATVVDRDSVRLAFIAILQHLPPRQRAVLILRDVLAWSAAEVATLLETSVASVNSALQRARGAVETLQLSDSEVLRPTDSDQQAILAQYVAAFESYDLDALAQLLHEQAALSMPPMELWFQGRSNIVAWMAGLGQGCRGSLLAPTSVNGTPAFMQYRCAEVGYRAWAVIVLEMADGRIKHVSNFLDVERLFPRMGAPLRIAGRDELPF